DPRAGEAFMKFWAGLAGACVAALIAGACSPSRETKPGGAASTSTDGRKTRTYYIAADEVVWNYAPTGMNQAEGRPWRRSERPLSPEPRPGRSPDRTSKLEIHDGRQRHLDRLPIQATGLVTPAPDRAQHLLIEDDLRSR